MPNPLFSSYRAGENRVTSSTIAVFERIDLALVEELLGSATGASNELATVTFTNQVVGHRSTPDAQISARFTWWFETKTVRGSYATEGHARDQVRKHSENLLGAPEAWLFVLTPDPVRPDWLAQLGGVDDAARPRVLWLGFRGLTDAIEEVISDATRLIGEQTRFLLTELVALYEADGLLTNDDTVVVAARRAWPEYQRTGAYVGQPNRSFRAGLTHFGFYTEGAIQRLVPRIREHLPSVPFTRAEASARRTAGESEIGDLIDRLLDDGTRTDGESHCITLLTGPDNPATVTLAEAVRNDTVTAAGRTSAWTQSQRYVRLDRLRSGVRITSKM